jgi:hypothetical protein
VWRNATIIHFQLNTSCISKVKEIVSLTIHDIINFFVALDKDMNSQCGHSNDKAADP